MRRWLGSLLAALAMTQFAGCGTVCNLVSEDPQPYGGIVTDVRCICECKPDNPPSINTDSKGALFLVALVFGDCAVSVVGDTLTLPLVILLRQNPNSDD